MVNRAKKPDQKKPNVSKHCMPERGPNMSTTPINKKTRRVAIAITPERFSFLFIAHDLSMVRFLSDTTGVMKNGKLVEMAQKKSFLKIRNILIHSPCFLRSISRIRWKRENGG